MWGSIGHNDMNGSTTPRQHSTQSMQNIGMNGGLKVAASPQTHTSSSQQLHKTPVSHGNMPMSGSAGPQQQNKGMYSNSGSWSQQSHGSGVPSPQYQPRQLYNVPPDMRSTWSGPQLR